ncbi:hypothetical protein DM02DRAFT_592743 [Periconia macrospinosa]|uniref:Ecp2 effector protein-like domain-containing protein n=1 Tax=Periconia macrospinosa TaxID=97972 RepID=A0A2V1DR36_9PLEO|nr:hypothetical protein DM02DRAFT_592743 [Periconia macrospinosa]
MYMFLLLLPLFLSHPATAQNQCTGDKSIQGYCTILSSTDRTSSATNPPSQSQCENTCRSTLSDAGDWIVDFTGQPRDYIDKLSQSKCSFSVGRGEGEPLDYKFHMHNQDIVDIIDDVNQKYGGLHGGKVAAEGTMNCEGHLATWYVN